MPPTRALLATLLLFGSLPLSAQEIDGIAAIVDDEIISIGQVRRVASLLQGDILRGAFPQCGGVGSGDDIELLRAATECLIDTTLVFREVRRFPQLQISEADVDVAIDALRSEAGVGANLAGDLSRWQLSEPELREVVRRQLLVAAYVDGRFRAIVQVSDEDIGKAWAEELAPDMRARGIPVPPLEDVVDDLVRPLLQEREVNRLVQSWIADLRQRATIQRRFP